MDEILTHAQMKSRYDGQCVFVEDPEYDGEGGVVRGKVIAHSPDRNEMYRLAMAKRPRNGATLYFCEPVPSGTVVVL